ncbi:DUF4249 family protein [Pedobacter nototheniae]|uniref:DUF4249 family protein n=1 Tax=Pedobacter nototheniae TaxID=2488994 RepID=UPI00103A4AE2|nr:DUF4249 family protein [Pedobacter nototheniae]
MIKKSVWHIMLCIILLSCKKEKVDDDYNPKFVVEGSIEQNGYANVTITHNLPFYTSINSAQLEEIIIKYAKVTVSDGQTSEVLTGSYEKGQFPYFVYKGSDLKGVVGKNYSLKIEYAGYTLNAETTIPPVPQLDRLWFEPKGGKDLQLNIRFTDNVNEKNYYKIYTKLEEERNFSRTLLSNQDDQYFNGKTINLALNRGSINNLNEEYDPYFVDGDKVMVKFASIPKSGYDFWQGFQNEILNASNPLMGSTNALKSNINGMAVGIWCGYGVSIYSATAKQ